VQCASPVRGGPAILTLASNPPPRHMGEAAARRIGAAGNQSNEADICLSQCAGGLICIARPRPVVSASTSRTYPGRHPTGMRRIAVSDPNAAAERPQDRALLAVQSSHATRPGDNQLQRGASSVKYLDKPHHQPAPFGRLCPSPRPRCTWFMA